MVDNHIDIKTLTLEELSGVVSVYPWYGAARRELCERMSRMGDAWAVEQFAANALYLPCRRIISDLIFKRKSGDFSDSDIQDYIHRETETPRRQIFVVGGDYFSQSQYDSVRKGDDNVYSSFVNKGNDAAVENTPSDSFMDLCTETLAQVYIEQGYPEEAKVIYSKLSLRYPEKSAYFAGLIAKIEENI